MSINSKGKAVLGFFRSVAVGIAVNAGYTALDQVVRSTINEIVKKRANKANEEKKQ